MTIKFSDKLILCKTEVTYRTDPTPDAATDAILATNVELTPMQAERADRNLQKPYFGASEQLIYGENVVLTFSVELQSSGTAGDAPAFGKLLKACGFSETLTALTDAVYKPISDAIDSVTFYMYIGTNLHEFNGARGTFTLELKAGIPYLNFTFTGIYVAPVTASGGTPDYTGFKKPQVTGEGRTSAFTIGGFAGNPHELTIDIGNDVIFQESLIKKSVDITGRNAKGNLVMDAPLLTDYDFFADAQAGTTSVMTIQHGQAAGSISVIDVPALQPLNPSYGDKNGIATLNMEMSLVPVTGNDELTLTFK